MTKRLGRGYAYLLSILTKNNLKIVDEFLSKSETVGESILSKLDELNKTIVGNTDELCEVLEIDYLNKESLKEVIENYGSQEFQSVTLLKGKYDEKKERRVFFIQKMDGNKKPVIEHEILCLYVNNVDSDIQEWFANKEMVLINK